MSHRGRWQQKILILENPLEAQTSRGSDPLAGRVSYAIAIWSIFGALKRVVYRGGIRGIVELEILRQIEKALGGVPIQCFIDLIVGTRLVYPPTLLTRAIY